MKVIYIIALILIVILYFTILIDVIKVFKKKNRVVGILYIAVFTLVCIRGVVGFFNMIIS